MADQGQGPEAASSGDEPSQSESGSVHSAGPSEEPSGGSPLVARVDALQQRVKPLAFVWGVLRKFADDQAGKLAAIVSYYAFFSIFPLMLALSAILGFVLENNDDLREDITENAADQIPLVGDQIANGTLSGSGLALVLGLVLAIWAGLGAMDAVTNAMNEVWDVPIRDRKGTAVRRARGLLMLVVIGLGLIASTLLAGFAAQLPDLPGIGAVGLRVGRRDRQHPAVPGVVPGPLRPVPPVGLAVAGRDPRRGDQLHPPAGGRRHDGQQQEQRRPTASSPS